VLTRTLEVAQVDTPLAYVQRRRATCLVLILGPRNKMSGEILSTVEQDERDVLIGGVNGVLSSSLADAVVKPAGRPRGNGPQLSPT
jgi:hypothetical protein